MSNPNEDFIDFALMAWQHRADIMRGKKAERCTQRIYRYYQHFQSMDKPDWINHVERLKSTFDELSHYNFWLQGRPEEYFPGRLISWCCEQLLNMRENDRSYLDVHMEINEKYGHAGRFDNDLRGFKRSEYALWESITNDPAFIFDHFLWHKVPGAREECQFRIYVTPYSQYCAKVYADIVRYMRASNIAPDGLKLMSSSYTPPKAVKMTVPGPHTYQRADKIVIYCSDNNELQTGVKFMKNYHSRNAHCFEDASPRSTKKIEGYRGLAITPQPTPDPELMARAGKTNIEGMSFGMSRSAVIYLAMKDCYKSPNREATPLGPVEQQANGVLFLNKCFEYARAAGLDLDMNIPLGA